MGRGLDYVVYTTREDAIKYGDVEYDQHSSAYSTDYKNELVFKTEKEAKAYLDGRKDIDTIVRYEDYSAGKKRKEMEQRLQKYRNEYRLKDTEPRFTNHSSKLLTCKKCESKINVEYMRKLNKCLVCGEDMRSDTVKKEIERSYEKVKGLEEKLEKGEYNTGKPTLKYMRSTWMY